MIKRLYIHNFKCLVKFELRLADIPNAMLIGRNGSGKSSIGQALEFLREIARGNNALRTNDGGDPALILPSEFWLGHTREPMRFTLEAELHGKAFCYDLALEFPDGFRGLRVFEESLIVDGETIFTREREQVSFLKGGERSAGFRLDWHTIALPLINAPSETDPLHQLRTWLSRMMIFSPVPSRISGEASGTTLTPDREASNLGRWLNGILSLTPSAYSHVDHFIREVFPDFKEILIPLEDARRRYHVTFNAAQTSARIPFDALSSGEKCFFVGATAMAANKTYGPLFCYWDEPDNHLSSAELSHFIFSLRRSFQSSGQLLLTSHHPEAIARFSDENTLVLRRNSHLEPAVIRSLSEIPIEGTLHDSLLRGDLF